jgi:hypothetical protein
MLPAHERCRLHFGPYTQPVYDFGDLVSCEIRGTVRIIRQSDAPIPWPVGMPLNQKGRGSLILFDALVDAVKTESGTAVMYWFGVSQSVLCKWRKTLGVPRMNPGSQRLFTAAVSDDPDRNEKIALAKTGVARPPDVMEKLHSANQGRRHSAESRRQMSESRIKPWYRWEDQLLLQYRTTPEIRAVTGRGTRQIIERRKELGIPDPRSREFRLQVGRSTEED